MNELIKLMECAKIAWKLYVDFNQLYLQHLKFITCNVNSNIITKFHSHE